jgi:hypothetical protein
LGPAVQAWSRTSPGGDVLRWRNAGLDQAVAEPSPPFFIEWVPQMQLPGARPRLPSGRRCPHGQAAGDAERLAAWLGERSSSCELVEGTGKAGIVFETGLWELLELVTRPRSGCTSHGLASNLSTAAFVLASSIWLLKALPRDDLITRVMKARKRVRSKRVSRGVASPRARFAARREPGTCDPCPDTIAEQPSRMAQGQ